MDFSTFPNKTDYMMIVIMTILLIVNYLVDGRF